MLSLVRVAARYGGDQWELYDLRSDPSETRDLAGARGALLAELVSEWTGLAGRQERASIPPEMPTTNPVKQGPNRGFKY